MVQVLVDARFHRPRVPDQKSLFRRVDLVVDPFSWSRRSRKVGGRELVNPVCDSTGMHWRYTAETVAAELQGTAKQGRGSDDCAGMAEGQTFAVYHTSRTWQSVGRRLEREQACTWRRVVCAILGAPQIDAAAPARQTFVHGS